MTTPEPNAQAAAPKVFISYSWSSPEYIERVVELAEHLMRDEVDVLFDQWDLHEGQDVHVFMERAVNDPTVTKVLILCDSAYVEKANARAGGVGVETLVISSQVYRAAGQTRFIPVIMERREDGSAPLPTYLESRFYVDLSDPERESAQYEQLLRALHGRPERERPPLGKRPAFLDETRSSLLTGRAFEQYRDAVLRQKPTASGFLGAYLERLLEAFEALTIREFPEGGGLRALFERKLAEFTPYRDEFVELVRFMAEYTDTVPSAERLHRFLEAVLAVQYRRRDDGYDPAWASEHQGFLAREIVLYATAVLLETERFHALGRLLAPFHVPSQAVRGGIRSVEILDPGFQTLGRNASIYGDRIALLIRERATLPSVPLERLLNAELLLAIRSRLDEEDAAAAGKSSLYCWHARGIHGYWDADSLPILARLRDRTYRDRLAPALGFDSGAALVERVRTLASDERNFPGWLNRATLVNWFGLGARPD